MGSVPAAPCHVMAVPFPVLLRPPPCERADGADSLRGLLRS